MNTLDLFEYQVWADEKLFSVLEQLDTANYTRIFSGYTSIKNRMDHILMALEVWTNRIEGYSPKKLPSFTELSTDEVISRWRELNTKLSVYFSQRSTELINYKTSNGEEFTNTQMEVAFHIINHTTFYRSQVIMMIRMIGHPVENTDFIYFAR